MLDNGASHIASKTRAWLADHPRFVVHHTPKHASWLNQVELFFSILSRKLLHRGEFASRDELVERIMAFIRDHNRTARPSHGPTTAHHSRSPDMSLTSTRVH